MYVVYIYIVCPGNWTIIHYTVHENTSRRPDVQPQSQVAFTSVQAPVYNLLQFDVGLVL